MLNPNNNAAAIKRDILVRLTQMQLANDFSEIDKIPMEICPDGTVPLRGSLGKDRAMVKARIAARLGHSVENFNRLKPLSEYVEEAYKREKPTWPMLTVIHDACNACEPSHYFPTDACQGCVARPCKMNCPKKAIEIIDHRARIDPSKCIGCGICSQNCPYHAIVKTVVPCENACPVGAISKDEIGYERIDYDKCIFCGKCLSNCPFGAVMDKSQLFDVVKHIMNGKRVVAMYAPAIGAQFKAKPGQLEGALVQAGFSKAIEVAIGADITADKETAEFVERMERGDKLMTTSCCPAYWRAVQIHVPDLSPCISETKSPMIYTAQYAKQEDPECVTVFVGPCLAKKREAFDNEIVDYVLTVEELNALFIAKEIDITKAEAKPGEYLPTVSGRNFAKTGGVAESVRLRLVDKSIIRPVVIDGLDKNAMKTLANYGKINTGKVPATPDTPNIVEVMACEGGCIAGPCVITNPKLGNGLLTIYANAGSKPGSDGIPAKCGLLKE